MSNITGIKEKKARPSNRAKPETFSTPERKTDSFLVKLSPKDHDRIREAAAALNLSKSEFVVGEAVQKYEELAGKKEFQHLEELDGKWFYSGRKLEVFQNFYLMSTSEYNEKQGTWADLYSLPRAAITEARTLCLINKKKEYEAWVREYEKEDD